MRIINMKLKSWVWNWFMFLFFKTLVGEGLVATWDPTLLTEVRRDLETFVQGLYSGAPGPEGVIAWWPGGGEAESLPPACPHPPWTWWWGEMLWEGWGGPQARAKLATGVVAGSHSFSSTRYHSYRASCCWHRQWWTCSHTWVPHRAGRNAG